jgi:very-short-patch-repair endonuclease
MVTLAAGTAKLHTELGRLGGVARVATLRRRGVTAHAVRVGVEQGRIVRVRHGWVAAMDADTALVRAASGGVVLACVTQAARLGLWTWRTDAAHVAAPAHAGRSRLDGAHIHWAAPVTPRHPDSLVDPIENVLALVASCLPREEALAIWESAFNKRLVDREALGRLALPSAARRLLAEATPWSDSGLETFVRVRLAWLRVPITAQVWLFGHRVDFLIGDRLVLQVDGGHHVGRQRDQDIRHDAELMLRGYHVIRVGYVQVTERWHEVQAMVAAAVAQGLQLAR